MSRAVIALCVAACLRVVAHAQTPPTTPPTTPTPEPAAKPTEAECRVYVEEGQAKQKEKSYDEARARFHTARVHCANTLTLVMIASTYQEQGDLPRALAYVEEFLAVVDQAHPARAATEKIAAEWRELVPVEQRVSIVAELSVERTTSVAASDRRTQLIKQVEDFDWKGGTPRGTKQKRERARGFFVGANLAYATMAKVEVGTESMSGRVDFPRVFGAELQAGYRFFPFLSVALAPQMFFNLQPDGEDAAHEFEVFVQTTGHLVVASQWDINLFAAPGYSVLIIPGAENARGLAFRYGGGPMFHLTKQISFAGELSHQIGFQRTERNNSDVDMETSFFSLLVGVRFRL